MIKLDRSTEKKTLTELVRLFTDPDSTAKRYSRNSKVALLAAVLCAVAAGILSGLKLLGDFDMLLIAVSGVLIGTSLFLSSASKQVPILKQHCAFDVESAKRRLKEIDS